jgi:hypothetical protein
MADNGKANPASGGAYTINLDKLSDLDPETRQTVEKMMVSIRP